MIHQCVDTFLCGLLILCKGENMLEYTNLFFPKK